MNSAQTQSAQKRKCDELGDETEATEAIAVKECVIEVRDTFAEAVVVRRLPTDECDRQAVRELCKRIAASEKQEFTVVGDCGCVGVILDSETLMFGATTVEGRWLTDDTEDLSGAVGCAVLGFFVRI